MIARPDPLTGLYLAIPAAIEQSGTHMIVRIAASHVNISVRRAGLDRDPGWIPWLNRTVRFVFEEDPPA